MYLYDKYKKGRLNNIKKYERYLLPKSLAAIRDRPITPPSINILGYKNTLIAKAAKNVPAAIHNKLYKNKYMDFGLDFIDIINYLNKSV